MRTPGQNVQADEDRRLASLSRRVLVLGLVLGALGQLVPGADDASTRAPAQSASAPARVAHMR